MTRESEFDRLAEDYDQILKADLGAMGDDLSVFAKYKVKLAHKLFSRSPERLLEFGCGIGRNFPHLNRYFPGAAISGCDSSIKSVEVAQAWFANNRFFLSDTVPAFLRDAEQYDACFIACVMHHIPKQEWTQWLDAVRQRLRPDGEILIFEHNLYNPLVKRIVTKSPIDANANFLHKADLCGLLRESGYSVILSGYTMFFPIRNALLTKFEWWLQRVPLGGQYFVLAQA